MSLAPPSDQPTAATDVAGPGAGVGLGCEPDDGATAGRPRSGPADRSPGHGFDRGSGDDADGPSRSTLWVHHGLLGLVVLVGLAIVGWDGVWTADEGALFYQATAVADGRGWVFPHPFPEADPTGRWFPIHLSVFGPDGGYVVLGKHTLFVHLVGLIHRIGGYPAVLGLSALSGLATASLTASLAGRLDRRAVVPTLWLTGAASPLFFNSFIAWGHTLASALVAVALLGLTGHRSDPSGSALRRRRPTLRELLGAMALAASILVRTEALLAGIALTMALTLDAARPALTQTVRLRWRAPADRGGPSSPDHRRARPSPDGGTGPLDPADRGRSGRWASGPGRSAWALAARPKERSAAVPIALSAAATVVGAVVDRATAIDHRGRVQPEADPWGGLAGRLEGFGHTWLRPAFANAPEDLLLLVSAGLVVGAGIAARRRPADHAIVLGLLGSGVAALVVRFVLSPTALVPGLLVAFPLLFAGLVLVRRSDLGNGPVPILAGFVVLFWGAVLATQYRYGGGGEWGGRYFAIGLPAAVPVAAVAGVRVARTVATTTGARLVVLVAAAGALPSLMGVLGLAETRDRTEILVDRVASSVADLDTGLQDEPVLLTTIDPLGRWVWEHVDDGRWLVVPDHELTVAAARLRSVGVDRLVFVTDRTEDGLAELAPWYKPIEPVPPASAGATLDRVVIPVERTN